MSRPSRILIIGCGYVGLPLGAALAKAGHRVSGIRRDGSARDALEERGIALIPLDITSSRALSDLPPAFDFVLNLVSSTRGGADEYRQVYLEGTRNIIGWLRDNPPTRYVYTSSTSVYGQTDGSWVTEESATMPKSETSRILVETERELLQAFTSSRFPVTILRVGGIYGPERGHLFKQFLRGEAKLRDAGGAYINEVHRDDLVGAITHLLTSGAAGMVYNVVDHEPVTQRDYFGWLSQRLKRPMPPSAPADPDRKRGITNKRVSNARLRETGYSFFYPSFREGYEAEIQRLGL